MEDNKSMFYIVSIIGIVAIVGMIVLIVNSTHSNGVIYTGTPTVSTANTATETGDNAGQAIRIAAARANAGTVGVTPGNGLQNNAVVKGNSGTSKILGGGVSSDASCNCDGDGSCNVKTTRTEVRDQEGVITGYSDTTTCSNEGSNVCDGDCYMSGNTGTSPGSGGYYR